MTETELKKMSRGELLQMLILQSDENTALKNKVEELEKQAQKREILIGESGTIAEAALKLSGIFEAADRAVGEYQENIRRLSADSAAVAKARLDEVEKKANALLAKAEIKAAQREKEAEQALLEYKKELKRLGEEQEALLQAKKEEAEKEATSILVKAKTQADRSKLEADRYWEELTTRLEAFYNEHKGLQELLSATGGIKKL